MTDPLHPTGSCTCAGEGTCAWCRFDAARWDQTTKRETVQQYLARGGKVQHVRKDPRIEINPWRDAVYSNQLLGSAQTLAGDPICTTTWRKGQPR